MVLYLIDGNSYIHRAYHAIRNLTTSKGESVNAVYGFTKMLLKITNEYNPDYIAVCFDYPAPTFRHKEFPEYKATRKKTEDELKNQFPLIKEVVSALNIQMFEKEGYEADDLIATIADKAEKNGIETMVVTSDKDVLQIVNDKINILNEVKNEIINSDAVKVKMGVIPENITDYLALAGDSSDNIPGVSGIGGKTAANLINQYGKLENIIEKLPAIGGRVGDLIKEQSESAMLSKKLAILVKDVPIDFKFESLKSKKPDNEKLLNILQKLEFYSLIKVLVKDEINDNRSLNYKTLSDETELNEYIGNIYKKKEFSFYFFRNEENVLTGMSISIEESEGVYLPIEHQTLLSENRFSTDIIKKYLKPLFEDANILKITYDLKSLVGTLDIMDFRVFFNYFDIQIASYLLNPSIKNFSFENIIIEHLQIKKTIIHSDFDDTNTRCEISDYILRCKQALTPKLSDGKLNQLFIKIETPLIFVLYEMEKNGILIDREYFEKLSSEFSDDIKKYEEKIYSIVNEKFNINSPKQLSMILFEKLNLKPIKRTKTGYSTNEEVLLLLAQQHELPKIILDYREISKLKSTFIDALINKINPKTKRLHTSFNQTGTTTGRLSSSEPNLQNIPIKTDMGKRIRRGFISEQGYILVAFDYSQIDLRVLAHITKDKIMCNSFKMGEDIHTITASEVFGVRKEDVTKEMRSRAKGINFGIIYGQQSWGLSQQLGISPEEAQRYINLYFERYSGIKNWITETIKKAKIDGFVSTLLGRIRYLPEINNQNQQIRSFAERTAINTPIQGTSADIIKVAMINITAKNKRQNLLSKCKMLLQVHDELLFEVLEEELNNVITVIKSEMENAVKLDIPVTVNVKIGKNWADLNPLPSFLR